MILQAILVYFFLTAHIWAFYCSKLAILVVLLMTKLVGVNYTMENKERATASRPGLMQACMAWTHLTYIKIFAFSFPRTARIRALNYCACKFHFYCLIPKALSEINLSPTQWAR